MEPANIRFGGGAADTMLSLPVAVLMLIGIALILVLPRRKVIVAFLPLFFCIPLVEVVVIGGVHFTVLRILIMTGLVRAIIAGASSSEGTFSGGFNRIDWMMVFWAGATFVTFVLTWATSQALIYSLGVLLDMLGGYILVRFLIPDGETIRLALKVMAFICVIQGAEMIGEQIIHQNLVGYLVAGTPGPVSVREGAIRSNGTMGCLYNGVFAGALVPLFMWLWTDKKHRLAACAGLAGAVAMVLTSHESTPIMTAGAGLLALGFWPLRGRMRMIRWSIVLVLVGLQMVMKAPVWALIARVDLIGGSSGYHRYMLVNNCITHFSDWWLMGYKDYNLWGYDMWDMCNQFVAVAQTGGLVTLLCYLGIFKRGLGAVGTARKGVEADRTQAWFLWYLGASLFATAVGYFGTSTTAQSQMGWFCLLAFISTAIFESKQAVVETIEAPSLDEAALVAAGVGAGFGPWSTCGSMARPPRK